MEMTLENWVEKAKEGHRAALEEVVRQIQDKIYGLAIRMLYYPADAEDATQEVLIKVITNLQAFRGESRFTTWVYRIASNHLLTTRKRRAEQWELNFDRYTREVDRGLDMAGHGTYEGPEKDVLLSEAKVACLHGMLLCLSRDTRLAFILGEIFQVSAKEGGDILEITPEAFRQRLSRGRKEIRDFMDNRCGLFNPKSPCQCEKQILCDISERKLLNPENLFFTAHPCRAKAHSEAVGQLKELEEIGRLTLLFRSLPDYAAPEAFVDIVKEMVDSERFSVLRA